MCFHQKTAATGIYFQKRHLLFHLSCCCATNIVFSGFFKRFLMLGHILVTIQAPFKVSEPDNCHYPEPSKANNFSYFPSLPQLHGNAVYQIDKCRTTTGSDVCNKRISKHPTLTPGIFTIYCPHAICYGFEILKECESP